MKKLLLTLVLPAGVAFANSGEPFQARCNFHGDSMGGNRCNFACPQMCEVNSEVIGSGSFESENEHQVVGTVAVEKHLVIGTYLALGADFETISGPDLRIELRDSTDKRPPQTVGTLDRTKGKQKYFIGFGNVEGYDHVVISSAKLRVDFGTAKLEKK